MPSRAQTIFWTLRDRPRAIPIPNILRILLSLLFIAFCLIAVQTGTTEKSDMNYLESQMYIFWLFARCKPQIQLWTNTLASELLLWSLVMLANVTQSQVATYHWMPWHCFWACDTEATPWLWMVISRLTAQRHSVWTFDHHLHSSSTPSLPFQHIMSTE